MLVVKNAKGTKMLTATQGKTTTVPATSNSQYRLLNKEGKLIAKPKIKKVDDDLHVFEEGNLTDTPDYIIENYYSVSPIESVATLAELETTFATGSAGLAWGTIGAVAGVSLGVAVIANDAGGKSTTPTNTTAPIPPKNPSNPTPAPTAKVSIDSIATINKDKAAGDVEITGKLSIANATTSTVIITVNGKNHTATITGDVWKVSIAGSELAYTQGTVNITAKAVATGNGQTAENTDTTTYTVDTEIAEPVITFGKVAGNDVINLSESKQPTTTITGTVTNAKDGDTVTLKIGTETVTGKLTGNAFSIPVATTALTSANPKTITVSVTTKDTAENIATGTANKSYAVNLTQSMVGITLDDVAGDDVINIAENAKAKTTLTGTLTGVQAGDTVVVTVNVNGENLPATRNGNAFSLEVDTAKLVASPTKIITATITAVNTAGNRSEATSTPKTYTVDTTAPTAKVEILSIAEDNMVNLTETGNVKIKGKVTGEFNVGDTVNLTVAGKNVPVKLANTNGNFEISVSAESLKTSTNPVITASFNTVDKAGNPIAAPATHQKSYTVEVPAAPATADLTVTLTKISGDNHLNVSEAKGDVTVTGTVTGADKSANQTVELLLGDKVIKSGITVGADGKFSTTVSGATLATATAFSLTAKAVANNGVSKTTDLDYTVDANASASIDITSIVDNVNGVNGVASVASRTKIAHISGTATFSDIIGEPTTFPEYTGFYANAKNASLVRTVEVKIGDTTYSAGVRDGKFTLAIPEEVLATVQGKTLEYTFKAEPWGFVGNKTLNIPFDASPVPAAHKGYVLAKASSISLDSPHLDNGVVKMNDALDTSTISGTVAGSAKADDVITVMVNGKPYDTTVNTDKTFSVVVKNGDLNAVAIPAITATLKTKDTAGNAIEVSDKETYATHSDITPFFVSGHDGDTIPTNYMVANMGLNPKLNNPPREIVDPTNTSYTLYATIDENTGEENGGFKVGGEPVKAGSDKVIKYYFGDKAVFDQLPLDDQKALLGEAYDDVDKSSIVALDDTVKGLIKKAYEQLSSYVGVKFEPTNNAYDAHTHIFSANFGGKVAGAAAFAFNSGALWWNAEHLNPATETAKKDAMYTALHEIGHTLNMLHPHEQFTADQVAETSAEFSYLTYRSAVNHSSFWNLGTYRMYDLMFLHYQLGVNKEARMGNDTYSFKEYNMFTPDGDRYIWDGNGVDTFDASAETQNVTVNLTPGSWVYVGNKANYFAVENQTLHNNSDWQVDSESSEIFYMGVFTKNTYTKGQAFIGYDTQIENLIGGAGNDTLTGNKADNHISGGAGNDTITGGEGDDYLDGGTGNDTLIGGVGDDSYVVDSASDVITEADGDRNDWLYASVDYILPANVEVLQLIGNAKVGTGNGTDNVLIASNAGVTLSGLDGNDILTGGLGADTLSGGAGNDNFRFETLLNGNIDTITDFNRGDKIVLSSDIFVGLTAGSTNNLSAHILYDAGTKTLSYDKDGAGEVDAIVFAKVEGDFGFDVQHFTVI